MEYSEGDLREVQGAEEVAGTKTHKYLWFSFFGVIFIAIVVSLFFVLDTGSPDEISNNELTEGAVIDTSANDSIGFKFGEEDHSIRVNFVGLDSAEITIQSEPITFILEINEVKEVDMDNDSIYDIRVKLVKIEEGKATIAVKKIDIAICNEKWNCSAWSSCSNGKQTRTCKDISACGTSKDKPYIIKNCVEIVIVENDSYFENNNSFNNNSNNTIVENFTNGTNITINNNSNTSQEGSLEDYIARIKAINCNNYVAPNCGIILSENIHMYSKNYSAGGTLSFSVFDEDCSAVCFGKALKNNCQLAKVKTLSDNNLSTILEIKGKDSEGNCIIEFTFEHASINSTEYIVYEGKSMICPFLLNETSLLDLSCPLDGCLEENMPGQTTEGVIVTFSSNLAFDNEEKEKCYGDLVNMTKGISFYPD